MLLKFRSMKNLYDENGRLLPDCERATHLGAFLRRTSLDELPQLINVLKGDMSLIGPRPLPLDYIKRYSPRQALRLTVKPGLSGWCQIHFRNGDRSWDDKLELDAYYVEHLSFVLDLRILCLTAVAVVRRMLGNKSGLSTSPVFEPNQIEEGVAE